MGYCSFLVLGVLSAMFLPLLWKYSTLASDQPWAWISRVNTMVDPPSTHFRSRIDEWQLPSPSLHFFQWWNYAIVDAETNLSWTIVYGISKANGTIIATASITERLNGVALAEAADIDVLASDKFVFSNDCDIHRYKAEEDPSAPARLLHFQRVTTDGSRYDIGGTFVDSKGIELAFNLTVHRIHGHYASKDAEAQAAKTCGPISTFFAYHSEVEGVIRSRGLELNIARSLRYRVYAGSSWGCYLPFGVPPIEYPWTWVWLVVPNEDPEKEIALSIGSVRYAEHPGASWLTNTYSGGAIFDMGKQHHEMMFFRPFHNSSFDTLLVGAVSENDGYFVHGGVEQRDWSTVTDKFGTAKVPLTQIFRFASRAMDLTVTVVTKDGEYFRLPFIRGPNIYSDFRANGVRAHLKAILKANDTQPARTLYDDWIVSPFSAVEYAYVDPYPSTDEQKMILLAPVLKQLEKLKK